MKPYRMLARQEWRALTTVAQVDAAVKSRAETLDGPYRGWMHRSLVNYELKKLAALRERFVEQETPDSVSVTSSVISEPAGESEHKPCSEASAERVSDNIPV